MGLSIAFLLPYGEPSDGFFPDALLAQLCAEAREAGHRAALARVYYDGRDAERDREVSRRLEVWLAAREVDLVVLERLFDPEPLRSHLARAPHRRAAMVTRGDSFDPIDGVDLIVGAVPGVTRSGATRRSPTIAELSRAFERVVSALAGGGDPAGVPGVASFTGGRLVLGPPIEPAVARRPFRAVVEQEVIALVEPPRVVRKTLFGNVGCPFADDPALLPHYRDAGLPPPPGGSPEPAAGPVASLPLARLGCAFCSMGGDYEKRPDATVVEELVEQALFWTSRCPDVEELVLSDQHALRYLAPLLRAAHAAGVRPTRWLFAARADSFVRERARIDAAVESAAATGHAIEVYLSGFEAFSDVELARYNKGLTVRDQLAAVAAMRELHAARPRHFGYDRARGHSLILWNPWTTPADLRESVEAIRRNGLAQLFHDLGRNRLRLYHDLPIYFAARRDGALTDGWEDEDEGAGRRKGYNVEQPWRFLDPRTRLGHALARALRDRLGPETEVAQLHAVTDLIAAEGPGRVDPGRRCAEILTALDGLEAALERFSGIRAAGDPLRGANDRACTVLFAGACNNGCATCANRDGWLDDRSEAVSARVEEARRAPGPIVFAGREPTVHPDFIRLLARARGTDGRPVGVVSNGRRFASADFTRLARRAGLVSASLKLFAPEAATADALCGVEGAFEQARAGIRELRQAGADGIEVRAPLHRQNLATFDRYAALAGELGADHLRVELALDAVGLDHLVAAGEAIDRLSAACVAAGMPLEVSPLRSATRHFTWLPRRRPSGSRGVH